MCPITIPLYEALLNDDKADDETENEESSQSPIEEEPEDPPSTECIPKDLEGCITEECIPQVVDVVCDESVWKCIKRYIIKLIRKICFRRG
jgi:hypothetical protein